MAIPNRNNKPTIEKTEQEVLNSSFDETFNISVVGQLTYNPITNTMERVSAIQGNPSLALSYDGSGNLTTITKTIGVVNYQKTLTYDVDDNLETVSVWTEV